MVMNVSYIYDASGEVEYAVVPIHVWEQVKDQVPSESAQPENSSLASKNSKEEIPPQKDWDPMEYYGMLRHLNLDVETEVKKMRDEWETVI